MGERWPFRKMYLLIWNIFEVTRNFSLCRNWFTQALKIYFFTLSLPMSIVLGHVNSIKEDRCVSNSIPIVKRQRTMDQSNINSKNGSPASNTNARVPHEKDRLKTYSNARTSNGNKPHVEKRTSVNVPKVEKQQTVPSTSSGNSMLQPSNTKQANRPTLRSSPSCLKPKPPDEVFRESLPLSFLLTKVAGIEPQFNHRLAMHIKGIFIISKITTLVTCYIYIFVIINVCWRNNTHCVNP